MKKKLLIIFTFLLLISGCSSNQTDQTDYKEQIRSLKSTIKRLEENIASLEKELELYKTEENINTNSNSNDDLLITESKSVIDDYWYYVVGTLKNNSQNNYEQVLIEYIALDKDGYNLVTCSDIAYDLKSGETYSFRATCVTDKNKVANYKLKDISPLKET